MKNIFFKMGFTAMTLCFTQAVKADGIYTIYPVPQQQVTIEGTAQLTTQVCVVLESCIDETTKKRVEDVLTQHGLQVTFSSTPSETFSNIYLGINGSGELADQFATSEKVNRTVFTKKNKYDRHLISLSALEGRAQILILGENTDATFYGIASLEQMLEQDYKALPCIKIYDYADQRSRGIVEGYYGYPYTVEVKKDLMRYMMRYKMNTYLYGAKSDPYHSGFWKDPYPTSLTAEQIKNGWLSQDMIKDLTQMSSETKVNFIWAIHPGNDILKDTTVVGNVMSKFNMMYDLGVRQFAVFVDDVGVPNTDEAMNLSAENISNIQKSIEQTFNTPSATAADTVRPLHFVPQVYCSSWVNENQRKRFFKSLQQLPQNITVYTTGWGVWSVPNQNDFNLTASELGRPAAWWWNYPCNDNADAQVYPMDMYSNFYDMPAVNNNATLPKELTNGQGIVCNPMQQGEISKIPLFSAADYAWNTSGFNNIKSWNAAFPSIVGKDKAQAFQTLARYIRWNDPDELNTLISNYKKSFQQGKPEITNLLAKLNEVHEACLVMETLKDAEKLSDRLLYNDLRPWLLKVKQMSVSVSQLLEATADLGNKEGQWEKYASEIKPIAALDTANIYKVYSLEGMGEHPAVGIRQSAPARKYLYPFVQYLKENALDDFFQPTPKAETTWFSNLPQEGQIKTDNDSVGLDNSIYVLKQGEYVGFALPRPRKVADVTIADSLTDLHHVLYSANGKIWKNYTNKDSLLAEPIKYLCVKNNQATPVTLLLPRSVFSVTLGDPTIIVAATLPKGPVWNEGGYLHSEKLLFDGDYNTFTCLNQNQRHGDTYTVELNKVTPIRDVRVCVATTNGDHMAEGNVEISEDGKTWTKIQLRGSADYDFTINGSKTVSYANDKKFCTFDARNKKAKYVRFVVKTANTNKWLRLCEIEVNRQLEKVGLSATVPNGNIWQNHTKEFMFDGNASTYVCLAKLQSANDTYSLKLKHDMKVNTVRVYMGTTNGDHMGKGQVEVSSDGNQWTKLYVKGTDTYDFTIDMPQAVDFANEVKYCDFAYDNSEVRWVRFVVTEPRTDKWLRLYEIDVNPDKVTEIADCVDSEGNAITTLNDATPYTGIQNVNQSLTYFFNGINHLTSVEIYQDASMLTTTAPANIKVTSDGETWNDFGSLTAYHQAVDLSQQSDAIAMKLEWQGQQSPLIYEIVTNVDKNHFAEVTKIEEVSTTQEDIEFSFNGKAISAKANSGIAKVEMLTIDGKQLLSFHAANQTSVLVPVRAMSKQTYLVRIVLSNGETATYKVFMK